MILKFTSIIFLFIIIGASSFNINSLNPTTILNRLSELEVDVAVIGGGIAGSTISYLLQDQYKCKVALIDPRVDKKATWYPNYGEWQDEWHVLSERLKLSELKECTTTEWEKTDCFFGGSHDMPIDERTTLPRAYVRVDRVKMQKLLRDKFKEAGGFSVPGKIEACRIGSNLFDGGIVHTAAGSVLTLDDGSEVKCKIVIDTSGLESRLVARENPNIARGNNNEIPVGYQIAYGFIAKVNALGPYDLDAMTLFDYRTNYLASDEVKFREANKKPTFMYAMPLKKESDGTYRVFFEETSLVGRGPRRLTFAECKERAFSRLKFHGIEVMGIEEEEYCYIPMGGELPDLTQRVVAFGGAANMVHPSTGYQACRMMAASTDVANTIAEGIKNNAPPDAIALKAYQTMWNPTNRLQRDFQAFGGDFLMAQEVDSLRGFFSAFFAVDQKVWSGFLAGWPGLPNNDCHDRWNKRLSFAFNLFFEMPTSVRIAMILFAISHTFTYGPNTLLRSLAPPFIFGEGPKPPSWTDYKVPANQVIGDEDAKKEARRMIAAFVPSLEEGVKVEDMPAPFN